jgi:hypothetical protein
MEWKIDIQQVTSVECFKLINSPNFLETLSSLPEQKNRLVSIVNSILENVGGDKVTLTIWGSGFATDNGWFSASFQFQTKIVPTQIMDSAAPVMTVVIPTATNPTHSVKLAKKVRDVSND